MAIEAVEEISRQAGVGEWYYTAETIRISGREILPLHGRRDHAANRVATKQLHVRERTVEFVVSLYSMGTGDFWR